MAWLAWPIWLLRGCVFVFLFALALKNSAWVELQFFLVPPWHAPLSAVLLGAFALGVVVGWVVKSTRRSS